MIQTLIDIGLTLNQAKIYLGYIQYGELTAAELSRRLNLDKSSVYKASEELADKGILIKTVKIRNTKYVAKSPDVLFDIFEQRKQKIINSESQINLLVNQLKESAKYNNRETYIKIEKGIGAHVSAMEDSLKDNIDKVIIEKWEIVNPIFKDKLYKDYVYEFVKKRVKLGIRMLDLEGSIAQEDFKDLQITSKDLIKEVRICPSDARDNNSFRVYKDTVEIISFDESNEFIIVTIRDKYISSLMKTMFYFIWNRSLRI